MPNNAKRINQAKELLTMIEGVDCGDTSQLAEINARAACCFYNKEYDSHNANDMCEHTIAFFKVKDPVNEFDCLGTIQNYATSRDALKVARPEGWEIRIYNYCTDSPPKAHCGIQKGKRHFSGDSLPTEELAEFHAIVQAWIYIWENE